MKPPPTAFLPRCSVWGIARRLRWGIWLQEPLESLLLSARSDDPGFSPRAAKAQYELNFFVKRFRRLVRGARERIETERRTQPREEPRMRRLLAAAVRGARNRAVIAAIAVGAAVFLTVGPFGGVAGMVGGGLAGLAVGESVKEGVKVFIEHGALERLSRMEPEPSHAADPRERASAILSLIDEAAHHLSQTGSTDTEDWKRWEFIAQRALFDLVQEVPQGLREHTWELAVHAMRELRDGTTECLRQVTSDLNWTVHPVV